MSCFFALILTLLIFQNKNVLVNSHSDFERDLNSIVDCFKQSVNNEDDCENCWHDSESLIDAIEEAIDDLPDDATATERKELQSLMKKAQTLEDFICAVGGLRSSFISKSDFYIANQLIDADVVVLYENKFCVDFVEVRIDDYSCILAESHQQGSFTLNYFWKQKIGSPERGSGNMGMMLNSFRPLRNSRDTNIKNGIIIYDVTCTPF